MLFGVALILSLCAPVFARFESSEQFDEELVLKPLHDGRLVTRFSFKTLLKGATPRNPATLREDDLCEL